MAMSVEKMNEKLEKILKQLDKAIDNLDQKKVEEAIGQVTQLNEKAEGKGNDDILQALQEKIVAITEEINDDSNSVNEVIKLKNIKKVMAEGKQPFQNIKNVVESLSEKQITQEDLKQYKAIQKNENLMQIEALKDLLKVEAKNTAYLEFVYMEKLNKNDKILNITKEIKKESDLLKVLNPGEEDRRIDMTKSSIKDKIKELSLMGIDVSSIQDFEENPTKLDNFISKMETDINKENEELKDAAIKDGEIETNIQSVNDLKKYYENCLKERRQLATKITTLEAENKQINKTVEILEREEQQRDITYNEDGTEKSTDELANMVYENENDRNEIRQQATLQAERQTNTYINEKYAGGFKDRFFARVNYYKEIENKGRVKSVFKAIFSRTDKVKRLEAPKVKEKLTNELIEGLTNDKVRELYAKSDDAVNKMERRQNNFRETLRRETAKAMSKNPKANQEEIKDDVMSKAYAAAMKDDRRDEEDGQR